MILEMQAAKLEGTALKQEVKSVKDTKVITKDVKDVETFDNLVDTNDVLEKEIVDTIKTNDIHEKYQEKITTLQVADDALSKDRDILTEMKNIVENTNFESLSRDEKVEVEEKLISLVDDINKISINTKFGDDTLLDGSYVDSDTDDNKIEVNLERIDSQTLGLSVDNISNVTLDSVRIQGQSYVPPYTFDVTEPEGASTALSVIETAITKIDKYRREVSLNISELTRYPECLELDRSIYSAEQAKIRSAEVARRQVTQLKSTIRYEINAAQHTQVVTASENIVKLFLNQ